ncbi:MAG: KEOPS complex subunit Pcc1 [Candidatus Thorarchaeota archaeon]|nr:MAG: hypothetical protein DRP09_04650 [Candidatus Thorarchaeota archaeon]
MAEVTLEMDSQIAADNILEAISPDNKPLPDGLALSFSKENHIIRINVQSRRGIDSFQSTIEDIMSAIDLALRVTHSVAGGSKRLE